MTTPISGCAAKQINKKKGDIAVTLFFILNSGEAA
jgi:hypothetical protein